MSPLGLILVIILIIALLGGFSGRFGGYGYGYGHGGISVLGVILIILVILLVTGRIRAASQRQLVPGTFLSGTGVTSLSVIFSCRPHNRVY